MLRAHLVAPREILVEDIPEPTPGQGDVRLQVEACGVCGSDIHAYHGTHPFMPPPLQPGHEFSGVVDALGEGVSDWQVGQRVVVEPSVNCERCQHCVAGRYHLCDALTVIGCAADGAMAEYVVVPARKLIALPDKLTFEQGALLEPLAVGVHALERVDVGADSRLVILGSGTIGLMTLFVARSRGVREITMTDIEDEKLAVARELGAQHTVNVSRVGLADFCRSTFGSKMVFDVAAECVGTEGTVRGGLPVLKRGGKMLIVGVFPADVRVEIGLLQDREIDLLGSLMYQKRDFRAAMDLVVSGDAPVHRLISSRHTLDELPLAMEAIDVRPECNLKTMIHLRPQNC
jgi:L-iditol 2-dehydrogenase